MAKFFRVRLAPHEYADKEARESELRATVALLTDVVCGSWPGRFSECEWPVLMLLSWICDWAEFKGFGSLWPQNKLGANAYKLDTTLGLFVYLGWDTDRTDVDLHVVEPTGEECYYSVRAPPCCPHCW